MAIYHCSVKIGSRGKRQSAVAAAAYRSGEKLTDKETGLTSDYTRKGGVVFSEISLCENAPAEYADRATLWNAVHQIEKSKNARLWREIEVALPKELSREEQIATIRDFVKQLTAKGMCADWSLHDKGDGNPHAHIMLTVRSIEPSGKWAAKSRKVYDLDENGERIFQKVDKSGRKQYKCHKEDYNDWNATERIEEWRAAWAECCNARLAEHDRIDHRSYVRQGVDRIPTIHEGYAARQRVADGLPSNRCNLNHQINQSNEEIQRVNAALRQIEEQIQSLQNKIDKEKDGFTVKVRQNTEYAKIFFEELQKYDVKVKWYKTKNPEESVGVIDLKDKDKYIQAQKAAIGRYVVIRRDDYIQKEMIFGALKTTGQSDNKKEKMETAKEWKEEFIRRVEVVQRWNEEISHFHMPKKKKELTESRDIAASKLREIVSDLERLLHFSMEFNEHEFECREADRELVDINLRRIDKKIENLQLEVDAEQQRNDTIKRYEAMGITQESVDKALKKFERACAAVAESKREHIAEVLEKAPMKENLDGLGLFPKVFANIQKRIDSVLIATHLKRKQEPKQPTERQEIASEQKPKSQGAYFSRAKLKESAKQVKQREEKQRKEQQQDVSRKPYTQRRR